MKQKDSHEVLYAKRPKVSPAAFPNKLCEPKEPPGKKVPLRIPSWLTKVKAYRLMISLLRQHNYLYKHQQEYRQEILVFKELLSFIVRECSGHQSCQKTNTVVRVQIGLSQ